MIEKIEQPNIGDQRIKKGFVWFPKLIDNVWRWLEFAEWEETLILYHKHIPYHMYKDVKIWIPTK